MTHDASPSEPEQLPAARGGPAPSRALQLRGNHALGMPVQAAGNAPEEEDDVLDLRDLWRMVQGAAGVGGDWWAAGGAAAELYQNVPARLSLKLYLHSHR